jgi:predicted HAD superfamily Cof-like phosphohydrolase
MKHLLDDVREFHEACGVPVLTTPTIPEDRIGLRLDILDEEHKEFRRAVEARDIVQIADALADVIYVAVGTALEFGIPLDRVWEEVQRSNMAKRDPVTGKVRRRDDGKVLKPEGWTPPNIAAALSR